MSGAYFDELQNLYDHHAYPISRARCSDNHQQITFPHALTSLISRDHSPDIYWLLGPRPPPPGSYSTSIAVSFLVIGLARVNQYQHLMAPKTEETSLPKKNKKKKKKILNNFSGIANNAQGTIFATATSASPDHGQFASNSKTLEHLFLTGLHAQVAFPAVSPDPLTPRRAKRVRRAQRLGHWSQPRTWNIITSLTTAKLCLSLRNSAKAFVVTSSSCCRTNRIILLIIY
jgi:hypothetical protein